VLSTVAVGRGVVGRSEVEVDAVTMGAEVVEGARRTVVAVVVLVPVSSLRGSVPAQPLQTIATATAAHRTVARMLSPFSESP
jgi:hypothetical protein